MKLDAIIDIMGGEKVLGAKLNSPLDFITYSDKGIPVSVVRYIQKRTGFTIKQMGTVLHISESTLQRRLKDQKISKPHKSKKLSVPKFLNKDEAEKAYHLSEIFAKGEEVFGNTEKFKEWLLTDNLAIGNKKPITFLSSSIGTEQILELLFGIQHGHFY